MQIKVLLADDSALVRRCMCSLLEGESGIIVAAQATNFTEAISLANQVHPNVMILDCHMPGDTCVTELRDLHLHGTRLLAVSFAADEEAQLIAKDICADQLLDKMFLADTLIPAILNASAAPDTAAATA